MRLRLPARFAGTVSHTLPLLCIVAVLAVLGWRVHRASAGDQQPEIGAQKSLAATQMARPAKPVVNQESYAAAAELNGSSDDILPDIGVETTTEETNWAATVPVTGSSLPPPPAEIEGGYTAWVPEPTTEWDPAEYELLAAPDAGSRDVLGLLPPGATTVPRQPLSLEELLAANRECKTITYANAVPATPGYRPTMAPLPTGQITIESTDFLDYDEERRIIYGHGRITARYGAYKIEADRMAIDSRLREIQAWGNVILTSDTDHVEGESLWANARTGEGVMYGTRGRMGSFHFLGDPECEDGRTTFRQLSENEAHLKEASLTTCDFPVPHYRLHAEEFTIMYNDRLFARNVVLYIMECPVLWLPYYTRDLKSENPWGATIGSDGELGFYLRVWYDYYHMCYTPSDVDDDLMIQSTRGHAKLRTDFFSKRGFGKGLYYSYYLNDGRHHGVFDAYQINDKERDVAGEDDESRSYLNWWNRTKINEELSWVLDIDWPSDSEIFYDIFDRVASSNALDRDRIFERRAGMGLELTRDCFFAGIQVEIKERLGRDRISKFDEPRDGDFDFDRRFNSEETVTILTPGPPYDLPGEYLDYTSIAGDLDNGVNNNRFGRVSERLPHVRVSSNRLRLGCMPLWYHVDLNMFNNLDKGLNIVSAKDDSYVQGFDLYQSLSHLAKFCDRYTLLTKVGAGVGVAEREDDSYNIDFPDGATFPFVKDGQFINGVPIGMTFVDEETFLVGTREKSLRQVEPFFAYGDIDSRFNARISDCTTAWVRYRYRQGTDDNLGEFYESIGSRKTRDDLYAFRNNEHWLEAGVNYQLIHPRLNLRASTGINLQGEDDIYAHEALNYQSLGLSWVNRRNTLFINTGATQQVRQMRDPTDPFEYQQDSMSYYLSGSYVPVHGRHYAHVAAFMLEPQDDDPLGPVQNEDDRDFDTRSETFANIRLGKKIGSKYLVEYATRLRSRSDSDDGDESWIRIQRDFHDLIAGVQFGFKSERLSDEEEEEETDENNFEFRFNFKFKQAREKGVMPTVRAADLYSASKLGAFETGG